MSDADYQAGRRGSTFAPGSMNYADWYAGKAEFDVQQGPKTEVDGVSFTALLAAYILAIIYPVAGAITAAGAAAAFLLVRFTAGESQFEAALVAAVVVGLVATYFGVKAERSLSRFRAYRVLRHVFRMTWLGGGILVSMFPELRGAPPAEATAGTIGVGLLLIIGMHFLFRALDRKLFPVRDSKAIKQEIKYAELTEEEVFAIKNAKFHGILWFGAAWFASTSALIYVFQQGVPFALLLVGPFPVLWLLRKRLFFRKHQRRLAEAAELRAQRAQGATFENASAPGETTSAA